MASEVLEKLLRERAPRTHTVQLVGPVSAIAERVLLTTFEQRLASAEAGARVGVEALTLIALAENLEIESVPIPTPTREAARFPDAIALFRQAELAAAELERGLAPLGGLGAVVVADLDRLIDGMAAIPDAANAVLKLVDNQSTVAEVLARSPHDLKLTARVLQRLVQMEIVVPAATVVPEPIPQAPITESIEEPEEPIDEVVAPAPDEMEGEEVSADIERWLEDEAPPKSLLSQDAFSSAFIRQTPERMMTPKPGTRAPLPELKSFPTALEEEEFFRDAGVGRTSSTTWIALAAGGAILGIVVGVVLTGGDEAPVPIDAGLIARVFPDAMTSTTSTAATSSIAMTVLTVEGRPPIAGPDAPEDVKRAERLLDAGRYQEARELLEQLRATREHDATVWILSGQLEVDVGRLTAANGMAERALELDPKAYRGWVLKGSVDQFRGRFGPAKTAYEKALELDPNHAMTAEIRSVLEQMLRSERDGGGGARPDKKDGDQ